MDVVDTDPSLSTTGEEATTDPSVLIGKYRENGDATKHVYYAEGDDGYAVMGNLGLNNVPIEGFIGAYWNWEKSGFADPFGQLSVEDFVSEGQDEEGNYSFRYDLTDEEKAAPKGEEMTLGYALGNLAIGTNCDAPMTSVVLKTDGTRITNVQLVMEEALLEEDLWGSASKYYYFALYDFDVIATGDAVEVYDGTEIVLPEADPELEEAFSMFRSETFTETNVVYQLMTPYDQDSYEYLPASYWEPMSYSVTEKGETNFATSVYSFPEGYGGMSLQSRFSYLWDLEEDQIQPLKEIGGKNYPIAAPFASDTAGFYVVPNLSMSPALFDKISDGVYRYDGNKWMLDYPVDNYSYYLTAYDGVPVEEMTLTLTDDGMTVEVESGGYYRMEATYNLLGATEDPVAADTIEENTDSLTWKDMVDPYYYETFAAAGWTDDIVNLFPTLGGDYICDIAYYDGEAAGFMYMFQYPGESSDEAMAVIADQYAERIKENPKWSAPVESGANVFTSTYQDPVSITDAEGTTKTYNVSITYSAMNMEGQYVFAILPQLTEVA